MTLRMTSFNARSIGLTAPFGLAVLGFAVVPATVGYQDLASLIAQRTSLSQRWREHVKSPFGAIHEAAFGFTRPAAIPGPDSDSTAKKADLTGSTASRAMRDLSKTAPSEDSALVNRIRKGDRLAARPGNTGEKFDDRISAAPASASQQAARTASPEIAVNEGAKAAPAPEQTAAAPAPEQTAAAPAPEPQHVASAANPAPQSVAAQEHAMKVAALRPSTDPAPSAVAPKAGDAEASVWDNTTKPVATDEAFASTSMAWVNPTADPKPVEAAPTAVVAPMDQAAAEPAAPSSTASTEPAPKAPVVEAAAKTEEPPAASAGSVTRIAEPVFTVEADPKPAEPASYEVASAGPDFVVPRQTAPKGEIAVAPKADEAATKPVKTAATPAPTSVKSEPTPAKSETAAEKSLTRAARTARIFFTAEPMAELGGGLEPWSPSVTLVAANPNTIFEENEIGNADLNPDGGRSVVHKGIVPGDGRSLLSPAERLGLVGEERAKAHKCLTEAIYFESRGEVERGQIAVAQVVMNRVFSYYYPNTVCGVVYQNSHRKLACQFTFACDGIPDRVKEPEAYERAKRIADETLDGKHWLPDVGKATHYHARWVHPRWVREMHKLDRIGVHTFYRPRSWGDGSDQPAWGDAEMSVPAADKL